MEPVVVVTKKMVKLVWRCVHVVRAAIDQLSFLLSVRSAKRVKLRRVLFLPSKIARVVVGFLRRRTTMTILEAVASLNKVHLPEAEERCFIDEARKSVKEGRSHHRNIERVATNT